MTGRPSPGPGFTCGVRTDHVAQCWGGNSNGELGQGDTAVTDTRVSVAGQWSRVLTSQFDACGLRTDRTLWCWGRNDVGQNGNGTTDPTLAPTQVR